MAVLLAMERGEGLLRSQRIRLIGDIPLFVAHQSADVWAHPELFKTETLTEIRRWLPASRPIIFSQNWTAWGLPVYHWEALQAENYRWWIERLRMAFSRFDINRLNHFIGFVRTYEISAQAKTALKGKYLPGGGGSFFQSHPRSPWAVAIYCG